MRWAFAGMLFMFNLLEIDAEVRAHASVPGAGVEWPRMRAGMHAWACVMRAHALVSCGASAPCTPGHMQLFMGEEAAAAQAKQSSVMGGCWKLLGARAALAPELLAQRTPTRVAHPRLRPRARVRRARTPPCTKATALRH